jgi:hypothetical protein
MYGSTIGYFGYSWDTELNGRIIFLPFGMLLPEYWGWGIASLMMTYAEQQCEKIASSMPLEVEKRYRVWKKKKAREVIAFFQRKGFQIERHFNCMMRPVALPLSDFPLPPGLEIRPVEPGHYRKIWDANWEAFQDHWGYTPPTEEMYQASMTERLFQPHLWKVAWEGIGMWRVHNYYIPREPAFNRKRGLLRISVQRTCAARDWRKPDRGKH